MATDRTNIPVAGVHLTGNNMSIAHTPSYLVNNPTGLSEEANATPLAGLAIFTNPVEGHVDTGVAHSGDLGGAG